MELVEQVNNQKKKTKNHLLIFIAINLRPGMTSVGPFIGIIRNDIELSNWSAGLITSLPLIAFAVVSPIIPILSNRYSNEQ